MGPHFDLLLAWQHPIHCRHSSMENKMSWAKSCTHSGPCGGGPGSLFSWYTSLYSPLISPQEDLYPMSWMVGTSSLGVPCQQPLQIARSISSPQFCSMQEHPVEDEWAVGSTSLPPLVFIKKQVCI